jgi:hypothetical protein
MALEHALQRYEVPPPRPGFVDAVIQQATRAHGGETNRAQLVRPSWMTAMAAAIVMIILVGAAVWRAHPPAANDVMAQVSLTPLQSKTVNLLIDSSDNRKDATITITLADNLELEGFPGDHTVEWETALKQGKNLLSLPLRLKDTDNSHFEVAFTHGQTRNL